MASNALRLFFLDAMIPFVFESLSLFVCLVCYLITNLLSSSLYQDAAGPSHDIPVPEELHQSSQ